MHTGVFCICISMSICILDIYKFIDMHVSECQVLVSSSLWGEGIEMVKLQNFCRKMLANFFYCQKAKHLQGFEVHCISNCILCIGTY